jgi:nicotinate-nucleotide adenylyltransferase
MMTSPQEKRILLFGGTFDPVHWGHLRIGQFIAEARDFNRVLLLPSASPPHKPTAVASGRDRLNMLKAAVADDPLFDVDPIELHREGVSYTIDTVADLRTRFGAETELFWIIGADMLAYLPQWYRAKELVTQVRFITALRRPWHDRIEAIFSDLVNYFDAATVARLRSDMIETPLIDISSTNIRQALQAGEDISAWVPPVVLKYIQDRGLYR